LNFKLLKKAEKLDLRCFFNELSGKNIKPITCWEAFQFKSLQPQKKAYKKTHYF
jgi:hypothetical protein